MTIEVYRKGRTTGEWERETNPKVGIGPRFRNGRWGPPPQSAFLVCTIRSKGGGLTDVMVKVTPTSFLRLAQAMVYANPKFATAAFKAAEASLEPEFELQQP